MNKPLPALEEYLQAPSIFGKPLARLVIILFLVLLFILPLVAWYTGNRFYIDFATRLVCLSIAAVSLNLILGFGGMVSFGHAVYIGIGAYCRVCARCSACRTCRNVDCADHRGEHWYGQ